MQGRKKTNQRTQERKCRRKGTKGGKGAHVLSIYEVQHKVKGSMNGTAKAQRRKTSKEPFRVEWAQGKRKGYTAEEAITPESDAQDQWLEPDDTSTLYDTWQTDSSAWDWYPENDWEDAEANYQNWRRLRIGSRPQVGLLQDLTEVV